MNIAHYEKLMGSCVTAERFARTSSDVIFFAKKTMFMLCLQIMSHGNAETPLYAANVHAGFPSPADDHIDGELNLHALLVRRQASTFFVRAAGPSMSGAGIMDGDLLVVDRSLAPQHGDIVIAVVDGGLTVKRLETVNGNWLLVPDNPDFPSLSFTDNGITIWGVVAHSVTTHCRR